MISMLAVWVPNSPTVMLDTLLRQQPLATQLPHSLSLNQGSLVFQDAECFAQASDLGGIAGFTSGIGLRFVNALLPELGKSRFRGIQLCLHSAAVRRKFRGVRVQAFRLSGLVRLALHLRRLLNLILL